LLAYAGKVFSIPAKLRRVSDQRPKPQIPTFRALFPLLIMFLGRFGSLNSLEKTRKGRDWKQILDGGELPSADTVGRIAAQVDPQGLRGIMVDFCRDLRKNKALPKLGGDLVALVFDGHESMTSYRRHCPECLQREVETTKGRQIQYYHRFVFCSLVGKNFHLLIDVEPIQPGEGEVVTARRLLDRVHPLYSRAYDIVLGDALYLEGPFFQEVIDRGKDVLAVLKREDLNLFHDAEALFAEMDPVVFKRRGRLHRVWDLSGFTSFSTVKRSLRVVKSVETYSIKRQLSGEFEEQVTRWMWATTISLEEVGTKDIVEVGHSRWDIENQGFNEGVNHYQIDHVYRHEPNAMVVIYLLAMLAMNLFVTFYRRNLKPEVRDRFSRLDVSRMVQATLYAGLVPDPAPG